MNTLKLKHLKMFITKSNVLIVLRVFVRWQGLQRNGFYLEHKYMEKVEFYCNVGKGTSLKVSRTEDIQYLLGKRLNLLFGEEECCSFHVFSHNGAFCKKSGIFSNVVSVTCRLWTAVQVL